jgi:choline dehydrogenase-like flavoprotein
VSFYQLACGRLPFGGESLPQLMVSITNEPPQSILDINPVLPSWVKDFIDQFTEMYEKAGFKNIKTRDTHAPAGLDIHEMGGVRMGSDPKTSLLNKWNQLHHVKNVFVTDGACMTSTSTQNPSLTYMAFTARAVDFAVKEMKKGNL